MIDSQNQGLLFFYGRYYDTCIAPQQTDALTNQKFLLELGMK